MPQRSPVIFWLLLAATIAVDAVVGSWVAPERKPVITAEFYVVIAFLALILSQLSIVCIWSAVSSTKSVWTRIAPGFAVIVAAIVTTTYYFPQPRIGLISNLAYYGLHAALVLVSLWLLQRTSIWRRLVGASYEWRFSLADALIAMTVVAVLAALMRNSWLLNDSGWLNFCFVGSSVLLTVASVIVWTCSWHWLLRLAGVLGLAVLLGAALRLVPGGGGIFAMLLGAHYLIQSLVLSIWLGTGMLLPATNTSSGPSGPLRAD